MLTLLVLMPHPGSERIAREASGLEGARFDMALERLALAGFLHTGSADEIQFHPDFPWAALAEDLPPSLRQSLHRHIADALSREVDPVSAQVADQLAQAGDVDRAIDWLEKAAEEDARSDDHESALAHVASGLRLCPESAAETRARLVEMAVIEARACKQITVGLQLVDDALGRTTIHRWRGSLLLSRARLVSFDGDYGARLRHLNEARDEFAQAADVAGIARSLGELALPQGHSLSLPERIELGRRGLDLARSTQDAALVALCAGNLAAAEISDGNTLAFQRWELAARVIAEPGCRDPAEASARNINNWAMAAIAFGDYAEVEKLIARQALTRDRATRDPFFSAVTATYKWRIGAWDEALADADHARASQSLPQVAAVADAIEIAIGFERAPRSDVRSMEVATQTLVSVCEEHWAPLSMSMLMRIRAARREPLPQRGLVPLVELLIATGVRIGWDDILHAAAFVDPPTCRRVLNLIGDMTPVGRRAEASLVLCEGLLAHDAREGGVEVLLGDAAEAYSALGEPYLEAIALEALARWAVDNGKRSARFVVRAAGIYSELRADRSLSALLRRYRGMSVLQTFSIPPSQRHSGASGLTAREREVAELARLGYTAADIASSLHISLRTAQNHIQKIKDKLGARRKSDLVRMLADPTG